MTQLEDSLAQVRARISAAALDSGRDPHDISLLAVSKTQPAAHIAALAALGQRQFGENYIQEALPKIQVLDDPRLSWHFIGRLQSNKTRAVAEHFQWVHTVDRLRLARRLSEQRPSGLPPLQVCLQVRLGDELHKGGVEVQDLPALAASVAELPSLRLRGLMVLPAFTDDPAAQRAPFRRLQELMAALRQSGLALDTLSMGMSADLEAAVAEGATLVRVGTALFGARS